MQAPNTVTMAISIAALAIACNRVPVPASVAIETPDECREGESVPLTIEVKDVTGKPIRLAVQWAVDPSSGGTIERATLHCAKEGGIHVTATVGTVRASKTITVSSPLLGLWMRRGDDKDGMTVRVQASADGLSGYVVSAPGAGSLPFLTKEAPNVSSDFALKCVQQQWPPEVKKWKAVRRLTATTWSLSDLSKPVNLFRHCNPFTGDCNPTCKTGKVEFLDNYELTLIDSAHAETRDSTQGADTIQRWERVDLADARDGGVLDAGEPEAAPASSITLPTTSTSGSASIAKTPMAGPAQTETTRCPDGLKATPWHFGCWCGELEGTQERVPAPAPSRLNCDFSYPEAHGSACVWKCR